MLRDSLSSNPFIDDQQREVVDGESDVTRKYQSYYSFLLSSVSLATCQYYVGFLFLPSSANDDMWGSFKVYGHHFV